MVLVGNHIATVAIWAWNFYFTLLHIKLKMSVPQRLGKASCAESHTPTSLIYCRSIWCLVIWAQLMSSKSFKKMQLVKANSNPLKGKQSNWWQLPWDDGSVDTKYRMKMSDRREVLTKWILRSEFIFLRWNPEDLPCVYVHQGINGNFLERTQTVQSKNINMLCFRSNTLSHRRFVNTLQCVRHTGWHTWLAAEVGKDSGLWGWALQAHWPKCC